MNFKANENGLDILTRWTLPSKISLRISLIFQGSRFSNSSGILLNKNVDATNTTLEAESGTLTKLTLKLKHLNTIWTCTIWSKSLFLLKQVLHWEVGTISRLPSTLLWILWLCGSINLLTNPVHLLRNDRVSWGLATFQFKLLSRNQVNSNDWSPSDAEKSWKSLLLLRINHGT